MSALGPADNLNEGWEKAIKSAALHFPAQRKHCPFQQVRTFVGRITQFRRIITPATELEVWRASSCCSSFVISFELRGAALIFIGVACGTRGTDVWPDF
ncbi:hypothetical protein ACRQ5Q_38835 [Bradyrhizobium sp. PMVTL-01]|uniref:hypothetical protein n=1 Tax=Bradyrhizobium sp. PMVTL-01 TaxID=3434999 RepID=UPI003F711599